MVIYIFQNSLYNEAYVFTEKHCVCVSWIPSKILSYIFTNGLTALLVSCFVCEVKLNLEKADTTTSNTTTTTKATSTRDDTDVIVYTKFNTTTTD